MPNLLRKVERNSRYFCSCLAFLPLPYPNTQRVTRLVTSVSLMLLQGVHFSMPHPPFMVTTPVPLPWTPACSHLLQPIQLSQMQSRSTHTLPPPLSLKPSNALHGLRNQIQLPIGSCRLLPPPLHSSLQTALNLFPFQLVFPPLGTCTCCSLFLGLFSSLPFPFKPHCALIPAHLCSYQRSLPPSPSHQDQEDALLSASTPVLSFLFPHVQGIWDYQFII